MATSAYRVVITAGSPLSFSQRKPGGVFQESLAYVPGSALRGTVAAILLRDALRQHVTEGHHRVEDECDFCHLFLSDEAAIFTNAYPVEVNAEIMGVLPETAVSCKSHPGFDLDSEDAHGAFDTLVDRLCWETLDPAGLIYSPNCPQCNERIDAFRTIYARDAAGHYHRQRVPQRLLTRVAINRRRNVAEEGLLYSPWVMEEVVADKANGPASETKYEPTQFAGYIYRADTPLIDTLESVTSVGGGGSRGLNHVHIEAQEAQVEDAATTKSRIEKLNALIEGRWRYYQALGGNGQTQSGTYFTIDLQSDAVLRTADGRPTMVIDEDLLSRATGGVIGINDVKLVRSYATYHYAGGWNSAWKLPKPAEVCTGQGAVYLFRAPQGLSEDHVEALAKLQWSGIGERTLEGYGQVRICDEFHLVQRNKPA